MWPDREIDSCSHHIGKGWFPFPVPPYFICLFSPVSRCLLPSPERCCGEASVRSEVVVVFRFIPFY